MTGAHYLLHFAAFAWLGLVISLVVVSIHEPDLKKVPRKGFIAFLKLVIGSVIAILLVELLYEMTIFTYPFLFLLFGWLFLGDTIARHWRRRQYEKKRAAAEIQGS